MTDITKRRRLTELLNELRAKGAPGFSLAYNHAALLGIGRVENAVAEEGHWSPNDTNPVAVKREVVVDEFAATSTQKFKAPDALATLQTQKIQASDAWAVVESGNTDVVWFVPHSPRPLLVGRRQDNDIVISDRTISGLHANFRWETLRSVSIADSGSSNGLWVNDTQLVRGVLHKLITGDTLMLGRFLFRFYYPADFQRYRRTRALNQSASAAPMSGGDASSGDMSALSIGAPQRSSFGEPASVGYARPFAPQAGGGVRNVWSFSVYAARAAAAPWCECQSA